MRCWLALCPLLVLGGFVAQAGSLQLRVVDRLGGPVQQCRVELLHSFRGKAMREGRLAIAIRDLRPRDFTSDVARLDDLPAGEYAMRITAEGFPRTVSTSFWIVVPTTTEMTVRLAVGEIVGRVVDEGGRPVANAAVRCLARSQICHGGATFRPYVAPEDAGQTVLASTDSTGRYRLRCVEADEYELSIDRADFAPCCRDVTVSADQPTNVPETTLEKGTRIRGMVFVDGRPAQGVDVVLASTAAGGLWERARTASDGRFEFTRPFVSGDYAIQATRSDRDPYTLLLDARHSRRTLRLTRGHTDAEQDFVLMTQ
jgi:hypothetical protein